MKVSRLRIFALLGLVIVLISSVSFTPKETAFTKEEAWKTLVAEFGRRASEAPFFCEGRLTLTSGTPVTTSDVTGATTVYFTPLGGNKISLHTGYVWNTLTFSEVSVAVPSTTTTPFDIFAYNNGGSLALQTVDWSSDTQRSTGIVLRDGIYVKSGASPYRYLGTGRTTSVSGQTEDSVSKRFLWNYYNRQSRVLLVQEATNSWSYNSSTWRPARGQTSNRVELMAGVVEDSLNLTVHALVTSTSAWDEGATAIGANSITAPSSYSLGRYMGAGNDINQAGISTYYYFPTLGYNYYQWLESNTNNGTVTFYGGPGPDDNRRAGMTGTFKG